MEPTAKNLEGGCLLTNRRGGALYPSVGVSFALPCVMPIAFVWGPMSSFIALAFQNDTFACIP